MWWEVSASPSSSSGSFTRSCSIPSARQAHTVSLFLYLQTQNRTLIRQVGHMSSCNEYKLEEELLWTVDA